MWPAWPASRLPLLSPQVLALSGRLSAAQTGMAMLCAFPDRYCVVGSEPAPARLQAADEEEDDDDDDNQVLCVESLLGAGDAGAPLGDGTPVYRVPGIEIIIQSDMVRT